MPATSRSAAYAWLGGATSRASGSEAQSRRTRATPRRLRSRKARARALARLARACKATKQRNSATLAMRARLARTACARREKNQAAHATATRKTVSRTTPSNSVRLRARVASLSKVAARASYHSTTAASSRPTAVDVSMPRPAELLTARLPLPGARIPFGGVPCCNSRRVRP